MATKALKVPLPSLLSFSSFRASFIPVNLSVLGSPMGTRSRSLKTVLSQQSAWSALMHRKNPRKKHRARPALQPGIHEIPCQSGLEQGCRYQSHTAQTDTDAPLASFMLMARMLTSKWSKQDLLRSIEVNQPRDSIMVPMRKLRMRPGGPG